MKTPETLKTRPDITDNTEWLVWTSMQPENKGIEVQAMYRAMLKWCDEKGKTPTRRRLLNWIDRDRKDIPLGPQAPSLPEPTEAAPKCPTCKDAREVPVKPENAKHDWELEFTPCPDCSVEK